MERCWMELEFSVGSSWPEWTDEIHQGKTITSLRETGQNRGMSGESEEIT